MEEEKVIEKKEILPQGNTTVEDMEETIRTAEKVEAMIRKIKILAIKQTNSKDWVDMQGKPYLQSSGAEKIARLFGISWRICMGYPKREDKQDEKGNYYIYSFKGEFTMGGKSIEVIGTCSQRDKFFGKDKKAENGLKPASEIDETCIIKKANTNMVVRGITTILGIRNMTWDDIREGGIDTSQSVKVSYATGGAGGGKISEAQAKRLFAIMKSSGMPEDKLKKYLKENYKVESSKDINRTDYEAICRYIESYETVEKE